MKGRELKIGGLIIGSSLAIFEGFGLVEMFEQLTEGLEGGIDGFALMIELPVSIFLSTIETEIQLGSSRKI